MTKERNAFTLIELLVVIAIIALLLAILMPSLQIAKQHATAVVCLSNLNGLSKGWQLYAHDNNDHMVGGHVGSTGDPMYSWVERQNPDNAPLPVKEQAIRDGLLFPYVEATKPYHCPGDKRYLDPPTVGGSAGVGTGAYRSYSISGGMRGVDPSGGWQIIPHIKVSSIRNPGTKYVFVEEADGRGVNMGSWVLRPRTREWVDPFAIWHNERSTLGFADGHAEKHQWVDESTIIFSESQDPYYPLGANEPRNDLDYMIRAYPYAKLQ